MKVDVPPGPAGLDKTSWNALHARLAWPSAFLPWPGHTEWTRAFSAVLSILAVSAANIELHP